MAPPVFGSAGTYPVGGSTTTLSVPVPASVAANDLIIVPVYVEIAHAVTPPVGFTEDSNSPAIVGAPDDHYLHIYWKRATGADSGTYDFTIAAGVTFRVGVAVRITGAITSGYPFDVTAKAVDPETTSGVTPAVSLTTTGSDRLIVWVGTDWNTGTCTPPTGMTERVDAGGNISVATVAQPAAGSTGSVTGTFVAAGSNIAYLLAVLPVPTIAVDSSTPARVTGAVTDGTLAVTTGTFSPPAAVLVATAQCNARFSTGAQGTITNNGTALTWTKVGEISFDNGGQNGYAGLFVAVLPAARVGMTVTFTATPTGATTTVNSPSIKVYVVTGANTTTPVGSSITGSSVTNNLTTTAYTTLGTGSLGIVSACDWSSNTIPVSADTTADTFNNASINGLSGYRVLGAAGTSTTFNLDSGGTGAAAWDWVSVEIKAAGSGDSAPPFSAPPLGLFTAPWTMPDPWFGTGDDPAAVTQATDTVSTVESGAFALGNPVTATTGTATVTASPASTGGADGLPGTQTVAGTATITTTAGGSLGGSGTVATATTAIVTAAASVAFGGAGSAAITGTAPSAALPARAGAGPLSAAVSGTATVPGVPGGAGGSGPATGATGAAQIAATATGAAGGGPGTPTNGTATLSTSPTDALGAGPTTAATGAATITAAATDALASGPASVTATATTLQATSPTRASATGPTATATGTATATSTPAGAVSGPQSVTATGAATVTSAPADALAAGPASVVATATTLQATLPARASAAGSSTTTTGTATSTTSPAGAVAGAQSVTTTGTATQTTAPADALGSGPAFVAATATTLQVAVPAGATARAGSTTATGATAVVTLASSADGSGAVVLLAGTATSTAPAGRAAGGGSVTQTGTLVTVVTLPGRLHAFGGTQLVDIVLVSRGTMTSAERVATGMAAASRNSAAMTPADRPTATATSPPRTGASMTPTDRTAPRMSEGTHG